jgi:propanediol dehydratase small subunit
MNPGPFGYSGRDLGEVTLDAVRRGEVAIDDVRIHPDVLAEQAAVATDHGNPNLAANLLRAAELTSLPDDEVMALYELLRPHRATATELTTRADELQVWGAPRTAALVREAAAAYVRRGLVKPE